MHGIVFFLLQRFVELNLGADGWSKLFETADLPLRGYSPSKAHPDEEFMKLIEAATKTTGKTTAELVEAFGEYTGPELLALHGRLIPKDWRTLDVIANAEEVIHTVVRAKNPGAEPPVLRTQRASDNEVQLVYSSDRNMCSLAKGMARGLVHHFGETIEIDEEMCMLDGDPFCSMTITNVDGTAPAAKPEHPETVAPISYADSDPNVAASRDAAVAPTGDEREGRWLGTYRIVRLLGEGGMGAVYLAEDPALQRRVAIKVLSEELSKDAEMGARFIREARGMAALHHEHIVPIFHIGEHEGAPYIVMPRLQGKDLATWLEEDHRATIRQVLRIGEQTALALAVAHERKLVHRDIKPGNIWLEAPKGHVKLLDFGLCRPTDVGAGLTTAGTIIGTPLYMAPEAIDGDADARSDLYALGVVLYELITGVQPFAAEALTQILRNVILTIPPAPIEANPDCPAELSDLVMQLLSKDAGDRIQDAETLATRLGQIRA